MTEVINDHVMTGISLLVAVVFLVSFLSVLKMSQSISAYTNEQEAMQLQLNEYRKYNQYDNRVVYAQDVISAILQFRGEPAVTVRRKDGSWATWSLLVESSPYTTAQVSSLVPTNVVYQANTIRGMNDEVVGLQFVTQ